MGSNLMWIRNAQIVILTICVVIFGSLLLTTNVFAQSDDTFNRNADSDSIIDDSASNPDRKVFDGYDAPKKKIASDDVISPSSSALSPSYQSLLEQRMSDMERQIRELTGKVEQLSFENSQLKTNLEKSQTDFDLRLNEIKNAPKPAADTVTSAVDTSATTSTPDSTLSPEDTKDVAPTDSPTQQNLGTITKSPNGASITPDKSQDAAGIYEDAYADLKAGNAVSAQGKFESFLKKFPEHPLRANAVYWMGETFYAQGKYDQSTRVFAESYKKYPKGPKAADSLLKMGMSLGQNGKTKEACVTFKQLKKEYVVGQTAILRRADAEMAKLACK